MAEKLGVWLHNSMHFHERMMMRFLRRRGWVVFYLDEEARRCNGECWLHLYQQSTR